MNERLLELKNKDDYTHEEMEEFISLSSPGEFVIGPNLFDIGVININIFLKNLKEGTENVK